MSHEANKFPFEIPLGRYAMNFGALEWTLIRGIAMLVALDPARHGDENLSASFSKRVKRFDKLTRERISAPHFIENHGAMIAQIEKVAKTRNSLLHGPWFDMPGTDIDAEKSKLIEVPIRLGDLLKQNSARRVTPIDIQLAMIELGGVSQRLKEHVERLKEALAKTP